MDGVPVEYLQEVSGLEDQKVTLVRGVTHSPEVDRWIDDAIAGREGRLKDVAVEMLDYQDNTVKQYQLRGAFVERVTYSDPRARTRSPSGSSPWSSNSRSKVRRRRRKGKKRKKRRRRLRPGACGGTRSEVAAPVRTGAGRGSPADGRRTRCQCSAIDIAAAA